MPRDPSGNYTLPALGNPAVTNTPITIAWWNGTGTDLATAMTDSLSRSGNGGMLGPFGAVDGTAGAPGLTFQSETTSGLYRPTGGEIDVSIGGTRYSRWTSAGFQESFDGGATWKDPLYNNHGNQTFTGGLNFTAGNLTIGGLPVQAKVTKATTSTGAFITTSNSFAAVTNANISFTATGGPVHVQLVPDDTSNPAFLFTKPTSGSTTPVLSGMDLALSADGGSTFFALQTISAVDLWTGVFYVGLEIPVSSYSTWYTPGAGAATIGLYARGGAGCNATITYTKLCITQF